MKIDLVVCDLMTCVPTLEFVVRESLHAALERNGYRFSFAEVSAVHSLGTRHAVRLLLASTHRPPAPWSSTEVDAVHRSFVREMVVRCHEPRALRESAGALRAFSRAQGAGMKVAIDSGLCGPLVNVVLDRLGWGAGLIAAVSSADDAGRARPFPDAIHDLARRLEIRGAARIAKVGSSAADLQQGATAGCGLVVGLTADGARRRALRSYPHTHLVGSFGELASILLDGDPALAFAV